jgi:hypothetical protein
MNREPDHPFTPTALLSLITGMLLALLLANLLAA